ncbi:replicative DNA helicase [Candidatus Kaiserbacteria bacterium]|nr:replicative DNA helicase [Candidatus Kaiserbacteria bacterium]
MYTNGHSNGTAVKGPKPAYEAERLPPHNVEAEEALLGSLLIDPDAYYEISETVEASYFFLGKNGDIFQAIADMKRENVAVDFVTLSEELRRRDKLDAVGGEATLINLINVVPTAINAPHYARIIKSLAMRRRLIQAAGKVANAAYDESENVDAVIERSEAAIFSVTERAVTQGVESAKHGMSRMYDMISERKERGSDIIGLPTGLHDLDAILEGIKRSDLYILAGRPGMGKSAIERAIFLHLAKMSKRLVNFNLEMPAEQVWSRTISLETGIPLTRLRRGQFNPSEEPLFNEAIGRLSTMKMWVDDTPGLTMTQLTAKCRRLHAEHGLDLITLDYLQLMGSDGRSQNRTQEVGSISRGLKTLARNLDVPILALAQLSRSVENRQDKHPNLSDLRDSGEIEQDADVVMFVYRDEYYTKDECLRPNIVEIDVQKHRNGPTGLVEFKWHGPTAKISNLRLDHVELSHYDHQITRNHHLLQQRRRSHPAHGNGR